MDHKYKFENLQLTNQQCCVVAVEWTAAAAAAMDPRDLASLSALLKAPAKELVEQIFQQVFVHSRGRAVKPCVLRAYSAPLHGAHFEVQHRLPRRAPTKDCRGPSNR